MKKQTKEQNSIRHNVMTVVGIIMCVILTPILIINCTLLVKGFLNEDEVPMVGGFAPMIVLTDSMHGTFEGGDLIFIKTAKPEDIEVGDVIAFFDPEGNGTSVVSHRVVDIFKEDGKISFQTKGDTNPIEDNIYVTEEYLIGRYTGFHISKAGHVAMFMQTTKGFVICVLLPIILLVGYDSIRRSIYNKKHDDDKEKLLAELEELRKLKADADSQKSAQ